MDATTGPLITHQRAVFSFVSQHLEEEEEGGTLFNSQSASYSKLLWTVGNT